MSENNLNEEQTEVIGVHENYNIPESLFQGEICEEIDEIHDNIEKVHQELCDLFQTKEKQLLDQYKRQMTKAQQREKELTESTSESELKKRMIEKKEKLQKERQKFLETSIYFSNKCKTFKETLTKMTNTTKDLESEIQFLNEQIVYAEKHNSKLKNELEHVKDKVKQYDPNVNFDELDKVLALPNKEKLHKDVTALKSQQMSYQNFNNNNSINNASQGPIQTSQLGNNNGRIGYDKYISPYSKQVMHKFDVEQSDVLKAKEELRKQKEIYEKLNEFLNDQCFQETEFERIFLESVMVVKSRKNLSNTNNSISQNKLPQLSNVNASQESSIKRANDSTLDFTTLTDFDFNDFGKRQILEEFLSREEIKKYLYSLIFGQNNQQQQLQQSQNMGQSGFSGTDSRQI